MTQTEQREHHRFNVGIYTEVYRKSYDALPLYDCEAVNISLSGACIPNLDPTLRKGSRIRLLFVTTGAKGRSEMRLEARIEWEKDKLFGLSFAPMDDETLAEFNKFIYLAKVALRSQERTGP